MTSTKRITVHVPREASVDIVAEICTSVQALYYLLAWQTYEKYQYENIIPLMRSLVDPEYPWMDSELFSEISHEVSGLDVVSFRLTSSFEVSLSGLGEPIEAVAEIADPLRRAERKEQLRHDRVMNLRREDVAAAESASAHTRVMTEQMALIQNAEAHGWISSDEAREAVRRLLSTLR